jgi:hypothetical protein
MAQWSIPEYCCCTLHFFGDSDDESDDYGCDNDGGNNYYCSDDEDDRPDYIDYPNDPDDDDEDCHSSQPDWRECHCDDQNFCQYLPNGIRKDAPIRSFFAQVCWEAIDICNDDNDEYSVETVLSRNYPNFAWQEVQQRWKDHGNWLSEWRQIPERLLKPKDFFRRVRQAMDEYYHDNPNGNRG